MCDPTAIWLEQYIPSLRIKTLLPVCVLFGPCYWLGLRRSPHLLSFSVHDLECLFHRSDLSILLLTGNHREDFGPDL